jgi:hydrogenase maturation factor HypF (carbamoyltransferase family)
MQLIINRSLNKKYPFCCSSKRNDVKNGYQVGKDGNRYIECPDCGKRFTNITNMKKHIKVVHLNIRDYICEICSKAFAESRDLRSHIQLVHLKQKNFQCESCGRKFGENKKLRRHILAKHPDLLQ